MEKRYKETGYYNPTYYQIECPKCKHEAKVLSSAEYRNELKTKIECPHCLYRDEYKDHILYKIYVKRNCPDCGKPIFREQKNLTKPSETLRVRCSYCKYETDYKPNVECCHPKANLKGQKGDPFFGYALWLQTEVKGHLFWAYNREHLEEIKAFVQADLRERQSTYLMTMTARLPQFIKEAKNREHILKAIEVLLKKDNK